MTEKGKMTAAGGKEERVRCEYMDGKTLRSGVCSRCRQSQRWRSTCGTPSCGVHRKKFDAIHHHNSVYF